MSKIRMAAVLLAVALLATACGGGDRDAASENTVPVADATEQQTTSSTSTTSSTTTTTSSTTTTSTTTTTTSAPAGTDEEQIEALIEAYWRTVFLEAFNPPNPSPAAWAKVAVPDLSTSLAGNAQTDLDNGIGVEGARPEVPFVHNSQITVVGPLAIIFMCLRDEGRSYDLTTGETIEELAIITLKRMEAVNGPEGWLVSTSESLERFDSGEEAECAAAFPS